MPDSKRAPSKPKPKPKAKPKASKAKPLPELNGWRAKATLSYTTTDGERRTARRGALVDDMDEADLERAIKVGTVEPAED